MPGDQGLDKIRKERREKDEECCKGIQIKCYLCILCGMCLYSVCLIVLLIKLHFKQHEDYNGPELNVTSG